MRKTQVGALKKSLVKKMSLGCFCCVSEEIRSVLTEEELQEGTYMGIGYSKREDLSVFLHLDSILHQII